jgi:hypothetical protein
VKVLCVAAVAAAFWIMITAAATAAVTAAVAAVRAVVLQQDMLHKTLIEVAHCMQRSAQRAIQLTTTQYSCTTEVTVSTSCGASCLAVEP